MAAFMVIVWLQETENTKVGRGPKSYLIPPTYGWTQRVPEHKKSEKVANPVQQ